MKKELGKWLMDIAKYIATAVILSSVFGDVETWQLYIGATVAFTASLGFGLYIVSDNKEKDKNRV